LPYQQTYDNRILMLTLVAEILVLGLGLISKSLNGSAMAVELLFFVVVFGTLLYCRVLAWSELNVATRTEEEIRTRGGEEEAGSDAAATIKDLIAEQLGVSDCVAITGEVAELWHASRQRGGQDKHSLGEHHHGKHHHGQHHQSKHRHREHHDKHHHNKHHGAKDTMKLDQRPEKKKKATEVTPTMPIRRILKSKTRACGSEWEENQGGQEEQEEQKEQDEESEESEESEEDEEDAEDEEEEEEEEESRRRRARQMSLARREEKAGRKRTQKQEKKQRHQHPEAWLERTDTMRLEDLHTMGDSDISGKKFLV
jgi:hypothetical protein